MKTNARTVEDNKILNAVKMAGGENWLAKHCSTYRVSLRTQSFKNTVVDTRQVQRRHLFKEVEEKEGRRELKVKKEN